MIRHAEISDLPEIIRMCTAFCKTVGVPIDEQSAIDTTVNLINSDLGVALIGDGSMAGAIAFPMFFNKNILAAQELVWWVDKDKRSGGEGMEMLKALESWAGSVGAKQLIMLSMSDTSPQHVDELYLNNGYKPLEKTFVKVF